MSIVVRPVLETCDASLALLKDVGGAWLLSRSVVDHYVGARLAVLARKYKFLRYYLLVLLVNVCNSIRPLQSGEDGVIYRFY